MNVLVVEPGYLPYEKEVSNDLKDLQTIVGGGIEAIYPFDDYVAVVINAERENYRAGFNRTITERGYGAVFGTFFICSIEGEHFASLTSQQMEVYKKRFGKAENLLAFEGGNQVFTQKVVALPKPCKKRNRTAKKSKRNTR